MQREHVNNARASKVYKLKRIKELLEDESEETVCVAYKRKNNSVLLYLCNSKKVSQLREDITKK